MLTRGDANAADDSALLAWSNDGHWLRRDQVCGKVIFRLPLLGRIKQALEAIKSFIAR